MPQAGDHGDAQARAARVTTAWPALLVLGVLAVNAAALPVSVAAASTAAFAESLSAAGGGRSACVEAVERELDVPRAHGAGDGIARRSAAGAGVAARLVPAAGRETDLPPPWG